MLILIFPPLLSYFYCIEFTVVYAFTALNAFVLINHMNFFLFATNGINRAVLYAQSATSTRFPINIKLGQIPADSGRTASIVYVLQIFFSKMVQGGKHRVGCSPTQGA